MKTEQFICDNCGEDVVDNVDFFGYRLQVTSEPLEDPRYPVTFMTYEPLLQGPCNFCDIHCLKSWVAKFFPKIIAP